jgi:RNA exonuclease 1
MIENDYRLPSYISSGDRVVIPGLKENELPEELKKLGGAENDKGTDDLVEPPKVQTGKAVANGSGGWPETSEAIGRPEGGRYPVLAIDCEMVSSSQHGCDGKS